jgi:hypothetical protein
LNDLPFLNQIPDPVPGGPRSPGGARPLSMPGGASPTRETTRRRRVAAIGVSLAWLCAHLLVYGIRQDFAQLPASYVAAQVALPMAFGACCLLVALAPGKLGLGLGVGLVGAMAVLAPLSFWVLALGMPAPHPPAAAKLSFWLGSLLCLDITLSWASAPLLLVALATRRAFAAQAGPRSALLGAALGLLSGGAINLHCPNVDPWHLVAGHGVPVITAALLGAFLVVKWTRA